MIYVVKINGKEYEVDVEKGHANIVKTTTAANQSAIAPAADLAQASAAKAPAVSAGSEAIKAPIPGIVLDIKASAGASVKKGDILLILEAMKMENEVFAPRDCVVGQVFVTKGSSVETGDVLISIN